MCVVNPVSDNLESGKETFLTHIWWKNNPSKGKKAQTPPRVVFWHIYVYGLSLLLIGPQALKDL